MKKSIIAITLLSGILVLNSCKGKEETTQTPTESATPVETTATPAAETAAVASEPKSYTINVAPGTPEGKTKKHQ
jgi:PBP1b-binding outer membrane lipoprotein LpoB